MPEALIKRKVLAVDDNQDAAKMLGMMLKLMGHEVRTAFSGAEALSAGEEFQPDVLLSDIGMPQMDGYEVAQRVRESSWGKSVTLVALTGWGTEEEREKTRVAGFDLHLVKPVAMATLQSLLENPLPAESRTP